MTDAEIIEAILLREGGYVDHVADAGGPTNFGITMATLGHYRERAVTPSDVKAMSREEARAIYQSQYIERPGFGKVADPALRAALVDAGVNHGPENAVRMLQRAVGVPVDGVLGPVTLEKANAMDARAVRAGLVAARARFYGSLITRKPDQAVFAAGWMNRLAEFIEALA